MLFSLPCTLNFLCKATIPAGFRPLLAGESVPPPPLGFDASPVVLVTSGGRGLPRTCSAPLGSCSCLSAGAAARLNGVTTGFVRDVFPSGTLPLSLCLISFRSGGAGAALL